MLKKHRGTVNFNWINTSTTVIAFTEKPFLLYTFFFFFSFKPRSKFMCLYVIKPILLLRFPFQAQPTAEAMFTRSLLSRGWEPAWVHYRHLQRQCYPEELLEFLVYSIAEHRKISKRQNKKAVFVVFNYIYTKLKLSSLHIVSVGKKKKKIIKASIRKLSLQLLPVSFCCYREKTDDTQNNRSQQVSAGQIVRSPAPQYPGKAARLNQENRSPGKFVVTRQV